MTVTQKSVCITGADRGLGLGLARQMLVRGYRVFAGRYLEKWGLLDELGGEYPDCLVTLPLDVSEGDSVRAAAETIATQADSLELLINNAAIGGRFDETLLGGDGLDYGDMLRVYNTNVLGTLRVTEALLPLVLNSRLRLVLNISSEAGSIAACWRDSGFSYCMSKAALNMQAAIVYNAVRGRGGQVLLVHPGGMNSHMRFRPDKDSPVVEVPESETHYLTAEKSAAYIAQLLDDPERYKSDKPFFVNYRGDRLEW